MSLTAFVRLSVGLALILVGLATIAFQRGWIDSVPVVTLLEALAIVIIASYTLIIATRMRRSDLQAVVPSRVLEALDSLSEGLLILDENQQILLANQAFCLAVDRTSDQLVGVGVHSLPWICGPTTDDADYPWNRAIRSGERQTEQLMRFQRKDGSFRLFSINCSPISGTSSQQARGALATFRDVTQIEARRAEMHTRMRHLEVLALHDPLTHCLNRRALVTQMQTVWDQALESEESIACLMIDNDHFKQINDTFGHEVGDSVLTKIADTIRRCVPESSLVCRYGGEEFCVVLPADSIDNAAKLAERLRNEVEQLHLTSPSELRMTVSIGVSETRFGAANPQELITQADQCLYLAKDQGRNRVVVMGTAASESLRSE